MIFLGDAVGCSGVPNEVFGVLAILGQQEPSVSLVDNVGVVFKSVSEEFDSDVAVFLGGIFHPITAILRRCLDKVCGSGDVGEEVWF